MKVLVLGRRRRCRQDGQERACSVVRAATANQVKVLSTDFYVSPVVSEENQDCLVFVEDTPEESANEIAVAAGARVVTAPFQGVVKNLQKEGIIPEGWPRPLW